MPPAAGLIGGILELLCMNMRLGYCFPHSLLCLGMRANTPETALSTPAFVPTVYYGPSDTLHTLPKTAGRRGGMGEMTARTASGGCKYRF